MRYESSEGRTSWYFAVLTCGALSLGVVACGGEGENRPMEAPPAVQDDDGISTDPLALLNRAGDAVVLRGGEELARVSLLTEAGRDELTAVLGELASQMPHSDDLDRWPLGRVLIRIEENAPFIHAIEFMNCCGARDVCIWNLEIAGSEAGSRRHSIPLPHELGPFHGPPPTEVWVIVEPSEGSEHREVDYTLCTDGGLITDPDGGSAMFRSRDERAHFRGTDLDTIGSTLTELTYSRDKTILIIDARPGTVYRNIEPLLPLIHHDGIDEIRFGLPRD